MSQLKMVSTIATLTLREATRRKVLLALGVLTIVLLLLSAWGFSKLSSAAEGSLGVMTTGETKFIASEMLNLVMFGLSLIAALGTAFLAGPTVAGEIESGVALSILARPIRRWQMLLGKWLGLCVFGAGFVIIAGFAQCLIVQATVGYWPPEPITALALLAAETVVLLTLALLLSTAISPMASGVVTVGLFGATWIAGVVGGIGSALGNDSVAAAGTISRMLLPTDGLWRGAMHAFQDPSAIVQYGEQFKGFPFLSESPLTLTYLAWALLWVAMIWSLAAISFTRKDL